MVRNIRVRLRNLLMVTSIADPSTSKTFDPNDDPELAQALAASLQPQESGITNKDYVYFGPANQSQYDPGQWSMVPVRTSTRDNLLDPEPEDRTRDLGVPAFLKPSTEDNRLAALFTIYHEIPLVREIFLDRANTIGNYGSDREWWTGKPIETPAHTDLVEDAEDGRLNFVQELQRLMAFLDKTDRSYGSAEALANLPYVKAFCPQSPNLEMAVMEAYKSVFSTDNQGKVKKLFSKGVDGPEERSSKEFAILDLELPEKESWAQTLYDMADIAMWGEDAALNIEGSAFLKHIAEVIAFRFDGWNNSKKNEIVVPVMWYPDRYLESGRHAALEMRQKRKNVHADLDHAVELENTLTFHELRSGKQIKIQELFKAAFQHDQDQVEDEYGVAGHSLEDSMRLAQPSTSSKILSAEFRKLTDRIDQKLMGRKPCLCSL